MAFGSGSSLAVGRQGRPRAESHLLLRALSAADGSDVDQVRGRKAGFFHNDAVPFVVLGGAPSGGKEDAAAHLGQRELACLQRGEEMARKSQPLCQKEWRRSEDREL